MLLLRIAIAVVGCAAVGCCSSAARGARTNHTVSDASPAVSPNNGKPGGSANGARTATQNAPPALVLGDFEDDYGARFSITAQQFFQRSRNHFHIVQWNVRDQYFIAQNDSLNPSDPNKWTRIDWLPLTGMAPFEWAFCFTAYKAVTRAEAEAVSTVNREVPKTGCNGFPFSRMKRAAPPPL